MAAAIGEREVAHFTIIFAWYQYLHVTGDIVVAMRIASVILGEYHMIVVIGSIGRMSNRLAGCRPYAGELGVA